MFRGLEGLAAISPDEAIAKYPGAYWFISSLDYRYEIIGYLTEERGIQPEKIINYVPVHKIRSCILLQEALIYDRTGELHFCWRNPSPRINPSEHINAKALRDLRDGLIESISKGRTSEHPACDNCSQISERYYPVTPASWSINYFCNGGICNFKCSYCTLANAPAVESDKGKHSLAEMISACKHEGLLFEDYKVVLSTAGEPTLHPNRKDFYNSFDGLELSVNTNGSVFDKDLFDTMNKTRVLLECSVDAGTRETFLRIKGVDCFEKVIKNLTEYAKATMGIVALKYIFIPGVNDTEADIKGFISLCKESNAMFVIIAIDYFSVDIISEQTCKMILKLKNTLYEESILCVPYTTYETAEYKDLMRKLFD